MLLFTYIAAFPPPSCQHTTGLDCHKQTICCDELCQGLFNVCAEPIWCGPIDAQWNEVLGISPLFGWWAVLLVLVIIFADWLCGAVAASDEPELCHQFLEEQNLRSKKWFV